MECHLYRPIGLKFDINIFKETNFTEKNNMCLEVNNWFKKVIFDS